MKLWAGRFQKETDDRVNSFNTSLPFDRRMYAHDIEGSMAHAKMLAATGIIAAEDAEKILDGLQGIQADIESGKLTMDNDAEDIHMFIEAELTARIGDAGKRLHTARSRNDQVAVDIRLYLRDAIAELNGLLKELVEVLLQKAEAYAEAIMPGYTHLQRAQPITFGHHLMAYVSMLLRDIDRMNDCNKRMNIMPLGSGALAGTTYPIDRRMTASLLGFDAPCSNSLDGVSDRDFCMELASAVSICMIHLSRFSEEIILWCSWEFRFIELDDGFTTGSSIMPQKKNADVTELIRGKTGRVFGDLTTLLTMMKGLPLAYNKDMQEDKEAIFDAVDTLRECLVTFIPMLDTMTVKKENMRMAAAKGFINATDLADYLTKKGMPFRDAYKISGSLVGLCVRENTVLEDIPLDTLK
ncbi:MAG: argininosuccinate lyase, partial [Oscillospiraceae bacterium]|nr:argininosuccinate lyase [Oscillospiraceae bacterium]